MKKTVISLLLVLTFIACDTNNEKKANFKLQEASEALERGDLNLAKIQIDSIKILYPKAFEARKRGIKLMQQVEEQEQIKTLAYLNEMLAVIQYKLDSIKGNYVLEKDPEYQDVGNYFYPTQLLGKNINRSYLRGQVSEQGVMYLTSIYCGAYPINHNAVKVTAPDGTFAETPVSTDRYESTDLGVKTEKVDYKLGNDGNVIGFIVLNKDSNLKVEYVGGKKFSRNIIAADRKAIAELFELSKVLLSREEIQKEMKEANRKLEFVKRKIEEGMIVDK